MKVADVDAESPECVDVVGENRGFFAISEVATVVVAVEIGAGFLGLLLGLLACADKLLAVSQLIPTLASQLKRAQIESYMDAGHCF
mmetsp:Transcript_23880/g.38339  ORF Transcript_23880/g.38339 Transcript_23880/m.38339 type:complete len:86 (-) Transcript_23880:160-417(-)